MKLVVQIPCFNEAETLPLVLNSIPKKVSGVDEIVVLVIDDGSTDDTVAVAKKHGVKHFVTHKQRMGLARGFHDGIDAALQLGADIVVNTDGDNQYPQARIGDLVQPILKGRADIVIADRQTDTIAHFSWAKKQLQKFGSWVVNKAAGTNVPDAASGFRAYSYEALVRLSVITRFSYCMETIIQAGNKGIPIASIPVETNPVTRKSRLFKSTTQHVIKSSQAITKSFVMYKSHLIFIPAGVVFLVLGLVPFIRYLVLTLGNDPGSHIQSLLIGLVLLFAAIMSFSLAVVSDLIKTNRALQEDNLERTKKLQFPRK
jgi:glycosyltransferase involved in cell wall biosynthesis